MRERRGLQALEGNVDAALGAHAVRAFVDAAQRGAQRPPLVDVAHRLREIDFGLGEDRAQVSGVADAVEGGKTLGALAQLARDLLFEHAQAATDLRGELRELFFGKRHSKPPDTIVRRHAAHALIGVKHSTPRARKPAPAVARTYPVRPAGAAMPGCGASPQAKLPHAASSRETPATASATAQCDPRHR